jgi:hypothetical protein
MFVLPSILTAGVLSIPASALLPRHNSIAYDSNGVRMAVLAEFTDHVFLAPVFLPDGVTITDVILEARDPSGGEFGGHIKMELSETRYNTVLPLLGFDTGIEAAPGDTRITSAINHIVNNAEFGYGISITINNGSGEPWNQHFYKVIIHYTKVCEGDFDTDGDVDGSDLAVFAADFGRTNCP